MSHRRNTKAGITAFSILLLAAIIKLFFFDGGHIAANQTIGWGWDISSFIFWNTASSVFSLAIFLVVYLVLYFKRIQLRQSLIYLHIELVILLMAIDFQQIIAKLISTIIWLVLIGNIVMSFSARNNVRKEIEDHLV